MATTLQDAPSMIAKVADLYESGMSLRQVGAALGVSKSVVRSFMARNGIDRRQAAPGTPKVLPDDSETIARVGGLYQSGLSLHRVAAEMAVGYDVVRRFMVRNGIERRSSARPFVVGQSPADVERVRSLYESGVTLAEVGAAEGVTGGAIATFMERHGIQQRSERHWADPFRWVGLEISYIGAHARVKRGRGAATTCSKCGTSDGRIEWAHLSDDLTALDDFAEMCVPCHRTHDAAERKRAGLKRSRRSFDGPTYQLLHMRVRKAFGSANEHPCTECGITWGDLPHNGYMHWANLSNDYHDVNDFAVMCPACHGGYDAQRKRDGSFVPFVHPKEILPQSGG